MHLQNFCIDFQIKHIQFGNHPSSNILKQPIECICKLQLNNALDVTMHKIELTILIAKI